MQWRVTRGNFTGKQINLKYTERILRDRLPATIQEQSADNLCTFQHDGAPCHKTNMIWSLQKSWNFGFMGRKIPVS